MNFPAPDMPARGAGHCLCGAVRFEWRERPIWACHCHCESCRRAGSAAFASFFGVRDGAWSWTRETPSIYESSPGVRRFFCGTCGAPMAYAADRFPNETHFFAASMERPEEYDATYHVHAEERLPWVHLSDGLPHHEGAND